MKTISKAIHIRFVKNKTAFRFINGKRVSDKEWNRVVDNTKNPFVDLRKPTK